MSRNLICILVLLIVIVACGESKETEVNTISMEELMGDVSDIVDTSSISLNDSIEWVPNSEFDKMTFSFLNIFDTLTLKVGHPFDRFGYSNSNRISFIAKLDTPDVKNILGINLYQYYFTDSLKLNNAFYNWLDCFSDDCVELKINQDESGVSVKAQQILIYDTLAIFTKYAAPEVYIEHNKLILDSILNRFGTDYRYKINVNQKGDLSW